MLKAIIIAIGCTVLSIPVVAQAQPLSPQHSPVPAAVTDTGEYAENIYDAAKDGKWKDASPKLAALKTSAQQLQKQAPGNQALQAQIQSSIHQLDTTIAVQDQVRTMREANLITRDAAELTGLFHPIVPIQISYLDYYGRQLEIGAKTGDLPQLKRAANDLAKTWQQLRPAVVQHGGTEQAARWDKMVRQIQSADKASDYNKLAETELEEVDHLETLFEHPVARQ
jgi:hypothetical protein